MNRCWIPGWQFTEAAFDSLRSLLKANHEVVLSYASDKRLTRQQWVQQQALAITEPTILIGWSLGGMLAVEIAAMNPLVTQVQLLNTNVKFAGGSGLSVAVAENFMQRYERNAQATRKRFASLVDRQNGNAVEPFLLAGDELDKLQWLYDLDLSALAPNAALHVLLAEHDQLVPCQAAAVAWQKKGAHVSILTGEHSLPLMDPEGVASWMSNHG